ncbi:hypothetical protein BDV93DRAFT_586085 [Ceratobasidium sp. AG-I]|nr:hypothetical protein BDV93DRAFT_586085 [Ceratobasidium sp. AG-I]
MGKQKPTPNGPAPPSIVAVVKYLSEAQPRSEFISLYHVEPATLTEECYRRYANPSLPSSSSRYSGSRVGRGSLATSKPETTGQRTIGSRHRFTTHTHPEGLPYFQQETFVTCDNMLDSEIRQLVPKALSMLCHMLKYRKDTDPSFTFHQHVEFCLELKTLTTPPEFNYYIADHRNQTIFWADDRRPAVIEGRDDSMREVVLREEYWKHVEYFPCHRPTSQKNFYELKQLLAAYATDAATSEGSTSPMSAADIAGHLATLNSFGKEDGKYQTWIIARLYGLLIRGQVVNRYATQKARLDRYASLEETPAIFTDQYAMMNSCLTMGFGDQHLRRCSRTWADRIAYTESWRAYKGHYLKEWKEIQHLGCVLLLLSNELRNTGEHAADAANYFQAKEQYQYVILP